jgi:hypothetical protein
MDRTIPCIALSGSRTALTVWRHVGKLVPREPLDGSRVEATYGYGIPWNSDGSVPGFIALNSSGSRTLGLSEAISRFGPQSLAIRSRHKSSLVELTPEKTAASQRKKIITR